MIQLVLCKYSHSNSSHNIYIEYTKILEALQCSPEEAIKIIQKYEQINDRINADRLGYRPVDERYKATVLEETISAMRDKGKTAPNRTYSFFDRNLMGNKI